MSDNNPKINILLATYNGAKYIENQLKSIYKQTYNNFEVYVRDDGSTDNTLEIINEYVQNNNIKNLTVIENEGKNLKCPGSFYEIAKRCKVADYYAFCDQDDVWYPEKLQRAIDQLVKYDNKKMVLYYAGCDYVDSSGKFIRKSPNQPQHLKINHVLYHTPGSGFTIVFNEKVKRELIENINPGNELHDRWLIRGVACFGNVIYDNKTVAAHIRYEEAVTAGDAGNFNLLANFIKNELFGDNAKREKENLLYFYNVFSKQLSEDDSKTLKLFAEKNTIIKQIKKIFYRKRLRTRLLGEIVLRLMFVMGKI